MLRVGELVMVLAPILGAVLLYFMMARGLRISRRLLVLAMLTVFAFGGWLTWLGIAEGLNRDERYVPAMLRDGVIVPGHGA